MKRSSKARRNPATAGLDKSDVHDWPTIRRVLLSSGNEVFQVDARIGAVGSRKRFDSLEDARAEANLARALRRQQGESAFGTAELKAEGITPAVAMRFYQEHLRKLRAGVPLTDALDEWEQIKLGAGKSRRHISGVRTAVEGLVRSFPDRLTSAFETKDIDNHLSGLATSDQTKKNRRRNLHAFFNWCVRSRKYAESNPVAHAEDFSDNLGPTGTLTPEEAFALLTAEPSIRAWLVLQMFCGLRSSEADRIDWRDIHLARKFVAVPRQKAKGDLVHARKPRIPDNALAWLALDVRESGRVRPPACRDLFEIARWKVGYKTYGENPHGKLARHIAKAPAAERKVRRRPWPNNILRHTCLSAHYAIHGDQTAAWGGTSTKMLREHYNEVLAEDEARAWFDIVPDQPANVVKLSGR